MAKTKRKNYKSLKKLFQVYEHTGVCEFHYYPEDTDYATLKSDTVCKIFRELNSVGTELVKYKGKYYNVRNVEVKSTNGVTNVAFVQISTPLALKL